jgi:hypothetical protein
VALKVLYIKQLGLPTACKSLQIVANFGTNFTLLLATPFSGLFNPHHGIAAGSQKHARQRRLASLEPGVVTYASLISELVPACLFRKERQSERLFDIV